MFGEGMARDERRRISSSGKSMTCTPFGGGTSMKRKSMKLGPLIVSCLITWVQQAQTRKESKHGQMGFCLLPGGGLIPLREVS